MLELAVELELVTTTEQQQQSMTMFSVGAASTMWPCHPLLTVRACRAATHCAPRCQRPWLWCADPWDEVNARAVARDAPLLARIHQLRNAAAKKDVDACVEHGQAIANACVGGDERVQLWMRSRGWNRCLRMDITCTPTMHRRVTTLLFAKLALHQEDSAGSLSLSDQASLAEWCLERNLTPLVAMVLMNGLSDRIFEHPDWCGSGSGDGLWRIYRAPSISAGDEPEDTFVRCFLPVKNFKEQLHQVVDTYKAFRGWDTWAAYQPRRFAYGPTQLLLQREEATGVFNTVVAAVVAAKRREWNSPSSWPAAALGLARAGSWTSWGAQRARRRWTAWRSFTSTCPS